MGAIALQLLQGTAGLVSVASAGLLAIGAFSSVFMLRSGVPFPADVVCAAGVAGGAGFITGLPTLRLRALFMALATLSTYYIAIFLGNLYQSRVQSAQSAGFFVPTLFGSKGLLNGGRYWAWLLLCLVSILILCVNPLMQGRSGRALRIIREHELIAPTLGVSVTKYKLILFTLSSMVFGLEGGLMAHFTGNVVTDSFPLLLSFQYVAMIVIGGPGSIIGAMIGAAVVIALPVWVPDLVHSVIGDSLGPVAGPNIGLIAYGILVIVFVANSSGGVVGLLGRLWQKMSALSDGFSDRASGHD
jgi:branched-chain amino acid transport system permease protein